GYIEVQIGNKGVIYTKRSLDYIPLRIDELHETLGYGTGARTGTFIYLAPRNSEVVNKIKDRKINGVDVKCIELVDQDKHVREVCVDPSTNTLIRQRPFDDKQIMAIGTKAYPHFLRYMGKDGDSEVEIHITSVEISEQAALLGFEVPTGGISRQGCMNP